MKTTSTQDTTRIDDVRIAAVRPLLTPALLQEWLPAQDAHLALVRESRAAVARVLAGQDDRLLVIVGPCSIHDHEQAMAYARLLKAQADALADDVLVVMRVYFEKPRTTVGWKGYINDPHLDGSFAINEGLEKARALLLDVVGLGLPVGTEFLDLLSPQFISDLVSWGAIGARTTESQSHRQLASGLSCPVGFKNGTDGSVKIAADVQAACDVLRGAGLREAVMVDVSHANSSKQHRKQIEVAQDVAAQVAGGDARIIGLMIESHLNEGRQDIVAGQALARGVSVTDACIGFEQTVPVLGFMAAAVRTRRAAHRA